MANPKIKSNPPSARRDRRRVKAFKVSPNAVKTKVKEKQLLQTLAKTHKVRRHVRFRVAGGQATTSPSVITESRDFPVEESRERSPKLESALAAARERGRIRAAEVLSRKDMLSADELAALLGTTRVTVNAKRKNGKVLGLDGAKRGFRFPDWQLDENGKPYGELPVLLERLGTPWAVYRFLVQPHGSLDGLTGLRALERGKGPAVVAAAEGVARGDFT